MGKLKKKMDEKNYNFMIEYLQYREKFIKF